MPHITIVPTAQEVSSQSLLFPESDPGTPLRTDPLSLPPVVVIDALRATSTIASGLAAGVLGVIPVATVEEARSRRMEGILLAGERGGDRLPGFDFGNSPVEIRAATGRLVVLTTTNGTLATRRVAEAAGTGGVGRALPTIFAGAFVNRTRVADALVREDRGAILVCSGQDGHPAAEDLLAAGSLIARLPASWTRDDLSVVAEWAFLGAIQGLMGATVQESLGRAIRRCPHGATLEQKGYDADLTACAELDAIDVLPVLERQGDDLLFVVAAEGHGR